MAARHIIIRATIISVSNLGIIICLCLCNSQFNALSDENNSNNASGLRNVHQFPTMEYNKVNNNKNDDNTDSNNIKSNNKGVGQQQQQRIVRRLYGSEGEGEVRRHVRLLEEQSERSQTGFLSDLDHEVPYENHPYQETYCSHRDRERRRRHLQDEEDASSAWNENDAAVTDNIATATTTTNINDSTNNEVEDLYKPLRIRFETQALDNTRNAENAAKIDFIKSQILPKTAEFWSQALSVVPVNGNLKVSAAELENREFCGDSEFTEVPTEHISTGVPDTDLILYVSGTASSRFCRGTTLAVAVACNFDQYDRPTAGAINICLDRIDLNEDGTASEAIIEDNADVLKHEVAHVLGHSSNSYRFFWDSETGVERTPRPFESRTVTCVDDVERSLILPSVDTMKFFEGHNGQRYAAIVTPKVRAMARNQFNCQTLEGAKLENQPTGSDSCTGDHWDEHDFYPEALSGVISPTTNIMSHLTLALFEDSGWYRANYTQGKMNPWGLGAGCGFVDGPCVVQNEMNDSPITPSYANGYFCSDSGERGCSPALTHKLACSVIDYFYIQPQTLPELRFQYFKDEISMGGPRQADYCPLFGSTYGGMEAEQLACKDTVNTDTLNIYSEVYGSDSQCIPTIGGDGRCYRTACVKDEMVLRINIRGEWLACEYDFQKLDVRVGAGALPQTLTCPRLSTACPDLFCPFNCAGRGVCNYDAIINGTVRPACECFDKSDTSPGCSDSLIQKGDFFDDAGGLLDDLEEDFFDPLIAVFVDHPDKWTTSSWAWAAGLLTIFLIMLLCVCSTFWPESDDANKQSRIYQGDQSRMISPQRKTLPSKKSPSSGHRSNDYSKRTASTRSRSSLERVPLHNASKSSSSHRCSTSKRNASNYRNPSSYHKRYAEQNQRVVSPARYQRSQVHGNRTSSSTLFEM